MRHGQAAGGWDQDPDPPLSPLGRQQALEAAEALAQVPARQLLSSPLRRTQETAEALGEKLGLAYRTDPRLVEFPSPGMGLDERRGWLRRCMGLTWSELAEHHFLSRWREDIRGLLLECEGTAVLSTHFMVINAAVGWARGDERTLVFHPANCSVTRIRRSGDTLQVLEVGAQTEDIRRVL